MASFAEIERNEAIKAVVVTGCDNVFSMGGTRDELMTGLHAEFDSYDTGHTGCLKPDQVAAINAARIAADQVWVLEDADDVVGERLRRP